MKELRKKHALRYRPFLKYFNTQAELPIRIPPKHLIRKKNSFSQAGPVLATK